MAHKALSLIASVSLLLASPTLMAQTPQEGSRPSFVGTWKPAEPAKSSLFFNNGMSWIPGDGRLVIEQTASRLTVTTYVPDELLDKLLAIWGQHYPTVMYRIVERSGRSGGAGAGGDLASSWRGNRLLVSETRAGSRLITVYLSIEGDRLKKETHTIIAGENKESTSTEWFERIKKEDAR